MLGRELKEKGCDYVIALTHMRTPNDVRLAELVDEIDLILGGHDHVYEKKMVNGKYILKSGTDFRQFSVVTLTFIPDEGDDIKPGATASIEAVEVTSEVEPDSELAAALEKYTDKMETEMIKELGEFKVDLDGRFSSVRTRETNLGNFICDVMVAATNADFALLNSGELRSDSVHHAGPFFLKDLLNILPCINPLVLLEVTGEQVFQCLENGVSQVPKLEGRFPQVSGIKFAFDPKRPSGKRIERDLVRIGDEYVKKDGVYHMVTNAYLASGKDGYDCLVDAKVLMDEENGPTLKYALQNHFGAIAMKEGRTKKTSVHHQSLVTISRRSSVVRQLSESSGASVNNLSGADSQKMRTTSSGKTLADLEQTSLAPKVVGRIVELNSDPPHFNS